MQALMRCVFIIVVVCFPLASCTVDKQGVSSPAPEMIFGNPDYQAISYGGYRGLSREDGPTLEQLIDDVKILGAMDIKLLRTYNTSQFPQAKRLLQAIREVKSDDPSFEMYVMLGAWIESKNAWTEAVWDPETNSWVEGTGPDHTQGNVENNSQEIATAIRLANEYPDIVKAIAVGNEAMVQWAVTYFVYPKTILKWVNHLQEAKASGALIPDVWITSSDNYESWGGGNPIYHTEELTELMRAVDFVSVHTYPFHDSFYNPSFWGVLPEEESLPFEAMTEATMQRAIAYARKQYSAVAEYMASVGVSKPMHIGETGWASIDETAYGASGSKAADEFKQKVFHDLLRDWTDEEGISLFYFEAFDEQWKKADSPGDSENHFGLIALNNEVKYTLWDEFDSGVFADLTRDGQPLRKSFGGDREALLASAMTPPFRSQMAVRRIETTNPDRTPGEVVTEPKLLVVHNQFSNADLDASAPSAALKLTPWEGTTAIELLPDGEVRVETRAGDWWGASLELDADVGENLSKFRQGQMHFDIRGSSDVNFSLGFQTGNFLRGDQVNNFASFGPGTDYEIDEEWRSISLPIAEIDGGTDMTDVTNIVAFLSQEKAPDKTIFLRNVYFSQ
ncbi:MAG: glycosyl hydrolase family 17 protein [Luminiphilus sp.]